MLSANAPATVAPLVTFAAYAIIAVVKKDETLLSGQAFTSLSLIGLLTHALLILCQALPTFFQAVSCFDRIEAYCSKIRMPDLPQPSSTVSRNSPHESTELQTLPVGHLSEVIISYDQVDICWSEGGSNSILHDINLKVQRGFTAITGPVASGKSTLLASMIGEAALNNGHVTPQRLSGVAFCSQTPRIFNDTIRRNITGGLEFDDKWYEYALSCSCLQEDLVGMHRGDHTLAGSNGSSLSGGQRQRVVCLLFIRVLIMVTNQIYLLD